MLGNFLGLLIMIGVGAGSSIDTGETSPKLNSWGIVGLKHFYGGDDIGTWDDARDECMEFGMNMVRFDTPAEKEFVLEQLREDSSKGPVWLGARSVATNEMYVWSEDYSITNPASPPIGNTVDFYYMAEEGKMGLVLYPAAVVPKYRIWGPLSQIFC